jgi:cytochrome P450
LPFSPDRALVKDQCRKWLQRSQDGWSAWTPQRREVINDEILALIFILLIAYHETTVNLIGSGSLALLEHPDQLAKLRSEPAHIKTAIEELVRFVCPVEMATERYAREDFMIVETTIPRGELVMAVIGSANRDANYFDNPDSLDITRRNNKHLAFGHGAHYCLGA